MIEKFATIHADFDMFSCHQSIMAYGEVIVCVCKKHSVVKNMRIPPATICVWFEEIVNKLTDLAITYFNLILYFTLICSHG